MKALIADDEIHVRESIHLLLDWSEFGITQVFEADNGEQAMEVISREHPQIVFTDIRMPMADGIALMEWLRKNEPDTQIIVISGYSDFDYVRSSLQNGAIDYLLKPINRTHLHDAVEKAAYQVRLREKLKEDQRQNKRDLEDLISEIERSYFMKVLDGTSDFLYTVQELKNRFPDFMISNPFMLIYLELSVVCAPDNDSPVRKWKTAMAQICKRIRTEIFRDFDALPLYSAGKRPYIMILVSNPDSRQKEIYQSVLDFLETNYSLKCFSSFAVCSRLTQETIVEAVRTVQAQVVSRKIDVIGHRNGNTDPGNTFSIRSLYDVPMKTALRNKNGDQISDLAELWTDSAAFRSIDFQNISILHADFFINMRKLMLEWELLNDPEISEFLDIREEEPLPILDDDMQISVSLLRKNIIRFLHELADRLPDHKTSDEELFADIKNYIMEHSSENISLGQIAGLFFYSESFISRKFKQYTGLSYIEYLTWCRMQKAKDMLISQDISIGNVSAAVGYTDEKYFSRVFRNTFHVTPMQVRRKARTDGKISNSGSKHE